MDNEKFKYIGISKVRNGWIVQSHPLRIPMESARCDEPPIVFTKLEELTEFIRSAPWASDGDL